MRRLTATIAIGLTLLLLVACGDDADHGNESADDVAAGDTPATSPAVHPSPTLAIEMSEDRDPREVLLELIQDPEDPDLELIYRSLSERFRVIPFDETWVRSLAPRLPFEDEPAVEDLLVEDYDGYSVVRHREIWPAKFVFVVEDGEWRRDPGGRDLIVSAALAETGPEASGSLGIGMGLPDDYRMQQESDPDIDVQLPLAQGQMNAVGVREDSIDIAMTWEIRHGRRAASEPFDSHLLQDSTIQLNDIS